MDADNPLGLKSIDHLEFTCQKLRGETYELFHQLGFQLAYQNQEANKALFTQGQVRFLLKACQDPDSHSCQYLEKHGEGVSRMAFWVLDAEQALDEATKRGAVLREDLKVIETPQGKIKTGAIQGFGDVINEFVERPGHFFRPDMPGIQDQEAKCLHTKVSRIDHLTNNVPHGEMEHWVDFYKKIFGFVETRYFDIKGKSTGLHSKVVQLKNGALIIPINQPDSPSSKSQIQEFIDQHRGAGVQHIALTTPDVIDTVGELKQRGLNFLEIPDTYYELLPQRNFTLHEDIEKLKALKLLADGDEEGYLLQIFTDTYIGPLFFEYIQRKNHWGFGEGNFQALFDSIELDQKKRGYL